MCRSTVQYSLKKSHKPNPWNSVHLEKLIVPAVNWNKISVKTHTQTQQKISVHNV